MQYQARLCQACLGMQNHLPHTSMLISCVLSSLTRVVHADRWQQTAAQAEQAVAAAEQRERAAAAAAQAAASASFAAEAQAEELTSAVKQLQVT